MSKTVKIIIIAVAVIVILAAGAGYFVWKKYYKKIEPMKQEETPQTLGGQIYEQVQNPAQKLPETNPFQANTNPFDESKTNPFKEVYKNPFSQ